MWRFGGFVFFFFIWPYPQPGRAALSPRCLEIRTHQQSFLPLKCHVFFQAVVTGSRLHLNPTFLRSVHWTHQPRLSGCLISIGTLKKNTICPRSIPTSSWSSFPACSTTTSTLCLPSSHLWTPAVIPRILVCGAPGCRDGAGGGDGGGWSTFMGRLDLRSLLYCLF